MEPQTASMIRTGAIAVCISLFMYWLTASAPLFIIPLLFIAPRFRPVWGAYLPVAVVAAVLVGWQFVSIAAHPGDPAVMGLGLIGLYLPLSLLVGCGVWIALSGQSMLVKLVGSSLFAAVSGYALALWISSDGLSAVATQEALHSMIHTMFSSLMGSQMPFGMNIDVLYEMTMSIFKLAFLPLFVGEFGFAAFFSELLIQRKEQSLQQRMATWSLPGNAVWVFLIGWAVVLIAIITELPAALEILAWNITLSVTLLYMVQGMSIVASFANRKHEQATSLRTFILLCILLVIPAVNVIPLVGLPLLGVSETWINYRKNE